MSSLLLSAGECECNYQDASELNSSYDGDFIPDVIFVWHSMLYLCRRISKESNVINSVNRVEEVLEEKGIKRKWLAEKLGNGFCMVNSSVCNRGEPGLEILFKIVKMILQVTFKELIDSKEK